MILPLLLLQDADFELRAECRLSLPGSNGLTYSQ